MREPRLIRFSDADAKLTWTGISDALRDGHCSPTAQCTDVFLQNLGDTLLNRSAWIDGLGIAVKAATVFPNCDPSIGGGVMLFSPDTGTLEAVIDFHLVTKWKTAADSLLAARYLARPDARHLLVLGAGTVAGHVIDAYRSEWPNLDVSIWNRTPERAKELAHIKDAVHVNDLPQAVEKADIIVSATMSTDPIICGDWLQPGQHLDLIGAYRADMREADDTALQRARIFVDSRNSTLDHIGELKDPIQRGVITPRDIIAEFYDIASGRFCRHGSSEITLFKNGGGAHLDLMVCRAILDRI